MLYKEREHKTTHNERMRQIYKNNTKFKECRYMTNEIYHLIKNDDMSVKLLHKQRYFFSMSNQKIEQKRKKIIKILYIQLEKLEKKAKRIKKTLHFFPLKS